MTSVAYSPCGKWIASGGGSGDETVRIWDAATGAAVGSPLRGHSDGVLSVAFNQEGTLLASSSYDKTVKIWDPVSGEEKCTLRGRRYVPSLRKERLL